ncbi:MAG TPA: TIGR03435 family protein [Bryobacteraceae bacterium]|nr:TIGR03435 family protein [Bryobacteraceae bacterium]
MEKKVRLFRLHGFRPAQFAVLGCSLAFSQSSHQALRFDVASLRQSPPRQGDDAYVRFNADNAQISYRNVTFKLLLSVAYDISEDRISGGEAWTESQPYDISARLPANATKSDVPAMLQALLAERSKLQVHDEPRLMSAYDLVVANGGPKLKRASEDGAGSNYILKGRIVGPQLSMEALAQTLSRQTGRPVVDRTSLQGRFDIRLTWAPDEPQTDQPSLPNGPSIYTALQEQLGLQLRPAKELVNYLIIDHANRIPEEN